MQPSLWRDEELQEMENERMYNYLCTYFSNYIQSPLYEEIMSDLKLTRIQVREILARLEKENRIHPNSTHPKACH